MQLYYLLTQVSHTEEYSSSISQFSRHFNATEELLALHFHPIKTSDTSRFSNNTLHFHHTGYFHLL